MECKNLIKGTFFFFLLVPSYIFSLPLEDISFFRDKPYSIAKDYYIYRYLKEKNISNQEAEYLFEQVKRMNLKLFHLFAKQMDNQEYKKVSKCLKLTTEQLLREDKECKAIGISVYDAFKLKKTTLKQLSTELKEYKELSHILDLLSQPDVFKASIKDKKSFLKIINSCGSKNRKKYFNKKISKKDIEQLSEFKAFNKTVELIVTQRELKNLAASLLYLQPNNTMNHKTIFFMALNALEFGKKKLALGLLELSQEKAYYRFDKDKILFWKYLITDKQNFLDELNKSFDLNIYTIYAHEKLQNRFDNIISPQPKEKIKNYNINNPFEWTKLLQNIKDKNQTVLNNKAEEFDYKNTIGQYTFIKERAEEYKKSYFPFPFKEYLEKYSLKRQSLILAIARQESRFIPASVSTSYALGMMQFMPFLAKATAKKLKLEKFDLDMMFNPKTAYIFANDHLNYLEKKLKHPLYIAYAYNGGIGFTRRLLKSGYFFTKKKKYEPFLSMELIPYGESRKYAKKVLANYIIYMQLLGEKISLHQLIEEL